MDFYVLLNCLICQGQVKTNHLVLHSISLYRELIKCIQLERNNQLQSFLISIIFVKFSFFLEELIFTQHTFLITLYFHVLFLAMLRAADLQISSIQNRILVIVLQLQIVVDQVACSKQKFHLLNNLLCIFALLFLSIYES